jgi:outer membrane protein
MTGCVKIACLAGALVFAGTASGQTLEEALRLAEINNPSLESGRTDTELAIEGLEAARAAGRTTVSLTAQGGYESVDSNRTFSFNNGDRPTASLQVEAAKPVYTGGRIAAGVRSARAGIDAAGAAFEQLRQSVWLETIAAYMNVAADRETVLIRKNNVALLDEQVRAARDRFEVGVVTRTDVALAEARHVGPEIGRAHV